MKICFAKSLILILFLFVFNASAQKDCGLSNAPKLVNLSLGDSTAAVKNVFGKAVKFKVKNKGDRTFFQNYITKPAPEILRGVRALYLRFLDDRLYQIEVFYENRADWQTLEQFTADFAATNNFAAESWQTRREKSVIECEKFTVAADKILNPHIEITDKTDFAASAALKKKKN